MNSSNDSQAVGHDGWKLGELELDLRYSSVRRRGVDLDLPRLSFDLLACLARHAPNVVGVGRLMDEVWGDVIVSEETVKQRVKLLRQAISDSAQSPVYIESVRGRGYRLVPVPEALEAHTGGVKFDEARNNPWFLVIAALSVAVAVLLWWEPIQPDAPVAVTPAQRLAIAVITPDYLSPPSSGRFFAEGLERQLVAALALRSDVEVISARQLLSQDPEAFRAAGARAALSGTVQISADTVDVTMELVKLDDNAILWAASYHVPGQAQADGEAQRHIAMAIGQELRY